MRTVRLVARYRTRCNICATHVCVYARNVKRKNTFVKGMRVDNLIARNKKFALKEERVEVGTITLVALITT